MQSAHDVIVATLVTAGVPRAQTLATEIRHALWKEGHIFAVRITEEGEPDEARNR